MSSGLFVYIFVGLSVYLVRLSTCICLVCLSTSVCLVYLSNSVRPSGQSVYHSVFLSVWSVCLSFCLSGLSVYLSVGLSVWSICLPFCLSVRLVCLFTFICLVCLTLRASEVRLSVYHGYFFLSFQQLRSH